MPAIGPSARRQWYAVSAGMPSDAPSSNDASAGSGTACSAGTTQNSAAVPHWRRHAAKYTHTRSPTRASSTPSPTASITPAPSCPGTWNSNATSPVVPARDFQSVGLTPATTTRTSTSPGPGTGVGTSSTARTDDAPVDR